MLQFVTALISPRQAKPKVKMYPVYPPACMWISLRDQSSYRLQLPKCYALIVTVAPEVLRLVFDSCSQRSYITEKLKTELGLPVIGRDLLLIKTFGQSDARLRSCEIVQVGIKTACEATVYIQAYVVSDMLPPNSATYRTCSM